MPVKSFPNQKIIHVNKEMPKQTKDNKRPYSITYIDSIELASQNIHKGVSFRLYMYLINNQDKYAAALSPQDFSDRYGVSLNSAKEAVNDLISLGYLVQRAKNIYDFYEIPHAETIEPVEEIKKKFKINGEVFELTLNELIDLAGKEKAMAAWEAAK